MNNLLSLLNAADKGAVAETNFERVDNSLAFMLVASTDPTTGNPTANLGPPVAGAFVQAQLWVDAQLAVWRCTAAGSPGAWIQQCAAIVTANPAAPPNGYWIIRADLNFEPFYWTGAAWAHTP